MAMDRIIAAAFGCFFDRADGLWRRLRARNEDTCFGSESRSAAASRGFKERTGKTTIGASDPGDGYRLGRIHQKPVAAALPHYFRKAENSPAGHHWRGHLRHRRAWRHTVCEQL